MESNLQKILRIMISNAIAIWFYFKVGNWIGTNTSDPLLYVNVFSFSLVITYLVVLDYKIIRGRA